MSASHWYIGKVDGTWHMLRPDDNPMMRKAYTVHTECGKTYETNEIEHLQEAPAFCRRGSSSDRCGKCSI